MDKGSILRLKERRLSQGLKQGMKVDGWVQAELQEVDKVKVVREVQATEKESPVLGRKAQSMYLGPFGVPTEDDSIPPGQHPVKLQGAKFKL